MPESDVMRNTRHIYELINLCVEKGAAYAVVSPGSRCAPLLIACGRHSQLSTISVTDERSAAFIAMGIAQQTETPVILVCTSGTAGQNYAPAVTEAFYQQVPLFVLTADRPPEWIDQWDGQTIHQQNLYGDHVKASMDFIAGSHSLEMANVLLDQSLLAAAAGPVHINIPISKPFYPDNKEILPSISNTSLPKPVTEETSDKNLLLEQQLITLQNYLKSNKKVLIISGQSRKNHELDLALSQLDDIPVIGDIISNLTVTEPTDSFFNTDNNNLRPELLITLGRSVISEKHKDYFRKYKPDEHWHIGLGMVGDPYQTLTQVITIEPLAFFSQCSLKKDSPYGKVQLHYKKILAERSQTVYLHTLDYLSDSLSNRIFNQYTATAAILSKLPPNSALHLANSMTVRVANHIGLKDSTIEVWSNRGTSGIDGCVSTAVGHALANPSQVQTLIIGDLAFLYDRNGLWLNQTFPYNLKIVVMNNGGGGIFDLIPGPSDQGKAEKLFTTPHQRTALLTAQEFNLNYQTAHTDQELQNALASFYDKGSGILEVFTDRLANKQAFAAFVG